MNEPMDARTELERRWDDPEDFISPAEMVDLIEILKKERNCWVDNAKALQEELNKYQKK